MSELSGVNHIAFLTNDIERLAAFYEQVFGAAKVVDLPIPEPEGPGRHALISIGSGASLHAFEFARIAPPPAAPMFQRGRIDHFALNVPDQETFEQLRTKLLARGSTDGTVTDFGVMRVLTFTDPDGHTLELAHWVGGHDPSELDMSMASDDERSAQRAAPSRDAPQTPPPPLIDNQDQRQYRPDNGASRPFVRHRHASGFTKARPS